MLAKDISFNNKYDYEKDVIEWNKKHKPINGKEQQYRPGFVLKKPRWLQ